MKKIILTISMVLLGLVSLVHAHEGASGIVKERMDAMGEIAKAMKTIGHMIKGEADYDGANAQQAALQISNHADEVSRLFPEGSTAKPSEALPIIWNEWDEFTKLFAQMKAESEILAELAAVAKSSDDIRPQFALVGKTCIACHEKYRLKK